MPRPGSWWAVLGAALLVLTGCGIRPTAAVDAGDPPSGIATAAGPAADKPLTVGVYFLHQGKLRRVERPASFPGPDTGLVTDPASAALHYLFVGPDAAEFEAGTGTAIPPVDPLSVFFRPDGDGPGPPVMVVNVASGDLSILAQQQLSCTIRERRGIFATLPLRVDDGSGRQSKLADCPPGILANR
ncbi:MAG TPA: hypothetical protein VK453_07815 [Micromonosporaceae bacterium]|nr:hypothetical protein [Micromonosporaceae bacterium]